MRKAGYLVVHAFLCKFDRCLLLYCQLVVHHNDLGRVENKKHVMCTHRNICSDSAALEASLLESNAKVGS
jgi:hypothetical protein